MITRRSSKLLGGFALSALSALLLWGSFSYQNLGSLIFIAFVPMLAAQHVVFPPRSSALAPALSISLWLGAIIIPAFQGKSLGMALLPISFFFLSLALNKNTRAVNEREGYRWFILTGVAGWVGMELLRSFIPFLGTWAFVGYALWDYPRLIQPVSIVGIYGLDLVIMFVNYGLGLLLIRAVQRWRRPGDGARLVDRKLGVLILVVLAAWIGSSQALFHFRAARENSVRVAAIQPGLAAAAHLDPFHTQQERIEILSGLTLQAARQGAALIVWPEMGLGFDPRQEYTRELQELAEDSQAYLVLGYVVEDQTGFRNQAALLSPEGEFLAVYGKTHPMLASGEPRSLPGDLVSVVDTPVGQIGMMICFDNAFTDVARSLGERGVQLIANPSLLGSSIAGLMPPMGVFRALENRSALIMADSAYFSAIYDPRGRIAAQITAGPGEPGIVVAEVPIDPGGSIYAAIGDLPGWICVFCLVAFASRDVFKRIERSSKSAVHPSPYQG